MLVLFCEEAREAARIEHVLPRGTVGSVHARVAAFLRAASAAGCGVVAADMSRLAVVLEVAQEVRERLPHLPLVFVVPRDAALVRALLPLRPDNVVWRGEEGELWAACIRAQRGLPQELAIRVQAAAHVPPALRAALAAALEAAAPVRSIAELAAMARCHRASLNRQWRTLHRSGPRCPMQHFTDWVLLLHALGCRRPTWSWHRVAAEVGADERTLRALARRLMGRPLTAVCATDRRALGAAFVAFLERAGVLVPVAPHHGSATTGAPMSPASAEYGDRPAP